MEKQNSKFDSVNASLDATNSINSQIQEVMFTYSGVTSYTSDVHSGKNVENKNTSSNYSFAPAITDYFVVWLDSNIDNSNEVYQSNIIQLRQVIDSVKTFTNADECISFVTQRKSEKVFLIVSDDLGEQIVHFIQDIPQLKSIYVFCDDQSNHKSWIEQYKKVSHVTQMKDICDSLNNEVRRYDNYSTTISSLSLTDIPIRGLNELDQSFMYSQLLKEILLEINHDDKTKEMEDLVAVLRDRHANNKKQLELIDEFKQKYTSDLAIYSYTKYPFIYSTLNKALRTQDINTIIKIGFFIRDLHRQIVQSHSRTADPVPSIIYRGQVMLSTAFEKMGISKGGLLSFNNFLSTSANQNVSLMFAAIDPQETNTIGILFEIEIDPSSSYTSFAPLDNVGNFELEEEILFSMNTVFRINDIEKSNDKLWKVRLTLTSDNDEQLQRVTDSLRQEIGGGTGWHRLGHLMIILDEIDKAEEIYSKLLDRTPTDKQEELASLYNQLGSIKEKRGDYNTALSYFQKTVKIEEKYLPADHLDLAITYNNIAEIYHTMTEYSTAYSFHQKALQIRQKCLPSNDPLLAATHSNIAVVYRSMGDYEKARLTCRKALEIGEECFSSKHPYLATIYDNLASVHSLMGEYSEALSFYQKAHEINQKTLPSNHKLLLITYNNIASTYASMGKYSDARLTLNMILEIQQSCPPPNHPTSAVIYNNIGLVYLEMGQCSDAHSYFQKAQEIQEKCCSPNDPELVTTYNNIGGVYVAKREFIKALPYYKKALKIEKNYLPSDHPNVATTYNNIGGVYLDMKDYSKALSFFQKALEIRQKRLLSNHPSLAFVYNNMGMCYQGTGDPSAAISFYEKALKIHQRSAVPNYPGFAILYNNIGETYYWKKDYMNALLYFQQSLDVESKSLGFDHPNLAYTHNNIACALQGLQEYHKAFSHIKKAIDIATAALEPNVYQLKIFHDHRDTFLLKVLFILYEMNKKTFEFV